MKLNKKTLLIVGGSIIGLGAIYLLFTRNRKNRKSTLEEIDKGDEVLIVDNGLDTNGSPQQQTNNLGLQQQIKNPFLREVLQGGSGSNQQNINQNTLNSLNEDEYLVGRFKLANSQSNWNNIYFYVVNRPSPVFSNLKVGKNILLKNAGVYSTTRGIGANNNNQVVSLNEGQYQINQIWIDANGKVGAIRVAMPKDVYAPVNDDRSLEGKAIIKVL